MTKDQRNDADVQHMESGKDHALEKLVFFILLCMLLLVSTWRTFPETRPQQNEMVTVCCATPLEAGWNVYNSVISLIEYHDIKSKAELEK